MHRNLITSSPIQSYSRILCSLFCLTVDEVKIAAQLSCTVEIALKTSWDEKQAAE